MGRYSSLGWMIAFGVLALVLSPVLVVTGQPTQQLRRRAVRSRGVRGPKSRVLAYSSSRPLHVLLMRFSMHPMVIALTAPRRWVLGRVRWLLRSPSARRRDRMLRMMRGGHERLFPDDPPFLSGVREPRRPKPKPPTDSIALRNPSEPAGRD